MEAPCCQINFCGLKAYGNITDEVKIAVQRMINQSKNTVFNHHSQHYGVPLLWRMLTVLTEDSRDSTEWFGGIDQVNALNSIRKT